MNTLFLDCKKAENMPKLFTNPLVNAVAALYESFPYPNYSLLAKPLWQDGYLGSSVFIGQLYEDLFLVPAAIKTEPQQEKSILSVGSGEILPYILRKIEPAQHRLFCVDISKRSLLRG